MMFICELWESINIEQTEIKAIKSAFNSIENENEKL